MSTRINIHEIICGHFCTLKSSNGKIPFIELLVFIILPIALAIAIVFIPLNSKDAISLLVNLSSIFSALLLSVLVLIFDQEQKLEDKRNLAIKLNEAEDPLFSEKKTLLEELYFNISYSIFCSVSLLTVCLIYGILKYIPILHPYILKPFIAFFLVNLLLNTIMILKRMHTLLISK